MNLNEQIDYLRLIIAEQQKTSGMIVDDPNVNRWFSTMNQVLASLLRLQKMENDIGALLFLMDAPSWIYRFPVTNQS